MIFARRGRDLCAAEAPTEPAGETILTYFKVDDDVLQKSDRKELKILIREQYNPKVYCLRSSFEKQYKRFFTQQFILKCWVNYYCKNKCSKRKLKTIPLSTFHFQA